MPDLNAHMRLGIEVVREARLKVPRSTNYTATSSVIRLARDNTALFEGRDGALTQLRAVHTSIDRDYEGQRLTPALRRQAMQRHVRATIAAGVGNCGELSEVVAELLLGRRVRNVDRVKVGHSGGRPTNNTVLPHALVVVGRTGTRRAYDDDIGLPNTWGPNAVVIDAWDRVAFPASTYSVYWTGLVAALNGRGTLQCRLLSHYD